MTKLTETVSYIATKVPRDPLCEKKTPTCIYIPFGRHATTYSRVEVLCLI